MSPRLGIVVSHPIQYQVPLYRALAASSQLSLHVFFLSETGFAPTYDRGFDRAVQYDIPLVEGYEYTSVRNRGIDEDRFGFLSRVNPSLNRALRSESIDIALVHGYGYLSNWFVFHNRDRLPYMLRGESSLDLEVSQTPTRRAIKRAVVSPVVRNAVACLAIGRRNTAFYLAYGAAPSRIFQVPYCVEGDRFSEAAGIARSKRNDVLAELDLDPRLPTVLFAGKLQPWKRPLDVVNAFRQVKDQANLLVVGDGPLRDAVAEGVDGLPNGRFIGFANQSSMPQWYGVSDVFVMPSEREPWGLAVNEAMAGGCVSVVSTAVGCFPDLVTDETGRTFPVGDVESLATALRDLTNDRDLLARMSTAAQHHVATYSVDRAAAGIEAAARFALAAVAGCE